MAWSIAPRIVQLATGFALAVSASATALAAAKIRADDTASYSSGFVYAEIGAATHRLTSNRP